MPRRVLNISRPVQSIINVVVRTSSGERAPPDFVYRAAAESAPGVQTIVFVDCLRPARAAIRQAWHLAATSRAENNYFVDTTERRAAAAER